MNQQKVLELALEALSPDPYKSEWVVQQDISKAITAIKEALAQPEPVKIAHKHEWFRTGEMKVGQMRCISCGTWGQEEMPQRTWVGLTDEEISASSKGHMTRNGFARTIEAKLMEKNR